MAKITVKTSRQGATFRRAGRVFSNDAIEINSDDLTPDQVEQLRADSEGGMLEVSGLPKAPARTTATGGATREPSKAEAQAAGDTSDVETHGTGRRRG